MDGIGSRSCSIVILAVLNVQLVSFQERDLMFVFA
jgi:hypothetical protein